MGELVGERMLNGELSARAVSSHDKCHRSGGHHFSAEKRTTHIHVVVDAVYEKQLQKVISA